MTISHYPCYVYNLSPINLCNIFQNRAPPDSSEPLLWPPVKSVQIPLQITWARAKGAALVLHVRMEKWQTHSRRRVVSLVHDTWWNFSDPADCSTLLHVCKTITHTYRVGQGKFPFDDRVIRRRKRTKSSSVNSVDSWIIFWSILNNRHGSSHVWSPDFRCLSSGNLQKRKGGKLPALWGEYSQW